MTTRILPHDEYDKLASHPFFATHPPSPAGDIVVAEDAHGTIIGFWCLTPVIHIEPVWIDPAHRGGTVGSRLYSTVCQFLDSVGIPVAYCFAETPEVADYLSRLGLSPQPYLTFQLCLQPSPPQESPQERDSSATSSIVPPAKTALPSPPKPTR